MSYQEDFDIAQRYDLLCRASQSHVEQEGQRLQLAADLDVLDKIINHDLPELARSGSPDHFADILKSLNLELEHFREFCEFPDLAQKVVVGVGGAFSAGKSSLINTLLGKKRLVVEIDPTTSLPTYLLYGEQEQITALNLFRRRVILSQEEFASLTHEEKIKYGSQIAGLLRSAFVSDPDFAWKNIALLDTPGYSKPDSEQWSERTDESVARSQLNLSNFIIWVVSATQGTISEDDLKFLATLNADIPKLIVVSRADAKTPEDIAKIVALVKQTTGERGVNVLDVVPVSARKKNDYPVQPVVSFLEKWNEQTKGLSFAQNFKKKFVAYSQFVQGKQQQAKTKLEQINKLLFLSDHPEQISIIEKLQHIEKDSHKEWDDLAKNLEELQHQFFNKMNQLADLMGGYQEQLLDVETLLKDPHCSAEILQSYAERLNDEKLLNIIYQHENCPIKILENLINKPIGSLTVEQIEVLLSVELIYQDSRRIYEHLEVIPIDNLSVTTRLKISLSNHIKTKTQIKLSQDLDVNVRKNLAKNSNIAVNIQFILAKDKSNEVIKTLINNPSINKKIYLVLEKFLNEDDFDMDICLASDTDIVEDIQIILAKNSNKKVQIILAANENICKASQEILMQDLTEEIKINLVNNKNISEEIQNIFANDSDENIRKILASNLSINLSTQFIFLHDQDRFVKANLARNINIHKETQLALLQEVDGFVKGCLAANPSINYDVQLKLLVDGYINDLAKNPKLHEKIQLKIIEDTRYDASKLTENPNLVELVQVKLFQSYKMDKIRNSYYLGQLAKNPNLIESIQLEMAKFDPYETEYSITSYQKELCSALSCNKNLSATTQLKLVEIGSYGLRNIIRSNLAESPNLTEEVQLRLFHDDYARSYLAKNHSISKSVQLQFVQDKDDWLRECLATNPNIDEDIQLQLAKDINRNVRANLLENPNLLNSVKKLIIL